MLVIKLSQHKPCTSNRIDWVGKWWTLQGGDSVLTSLPFSRLVRATPPSFGSLSSVYQQTHQNDPNSGQAMADISNKPRIYHPPPNSILIKVPQAQVPSIKTKRVMLCGECDHTFADRKGLVQHMRNSHQVHNEGNTGIGPVLPILIQVYQCYMCAEKTIGYYRMASHTKKNHAKEPIFNCNCGRNFAEKRGLTRHQNSCTFYKNSWL